MPLSHPILRELFLVAAVIVAMGMSVVSVMAQETQPVTAGTTSYQNAPVNSILDLYEQLTDKHLIRDAQLGGIPPVSLNVTNLSKADTIKMIEQYLLLNGVAFIPVDEHTLKVITVGTNKNPRSEGVQLYANPADLPTSEQIITYYMPLTYINPQEAVGIFAQVAPGTQLRRLRSCPKRPSGHSHGKRECHPSAYRPEGTDRYPARPRHG